jgi:DNA-binding transcriptional LysR family regulator
MNEDWDDWRVVWAAGTAGTFTGAAKALGVGQATVSRRIAALEERLGHALFARTAAGLVRTPAADAMWNHIEAMRASWQRATAVVQGHETEPEGVVRVATALGIAVDLMPELAMRLRRSHPKIQLEILADNRAVDLGGFEADIAIRNAPIDRGDVLVRRLITVKAGVFGSAAYLDSLPPKPTSADLAWLQWAPEMAHIPQAKWIEAHNQGRIVFTTNNYLAMRAAAQLGLGLLLCSELEGDLMNLLPVPVELPKIPSGSGYLLVSRALRHVPRVSAVVEAILEQARELEAL